MGDSDKLNIDSIISRLLEGNAIDFALFLLKSVTKSLFDINCLIFHLMLIFSPRGKTWEKCPIDRI